LGNRKAEALGSFEIDHKLKSCWLLDRQIGGFDPRIILSAKMAARSK